MTRATEFLEEINSDLGGLLSLIEQRKLYYIFFYNDATRTYYIKIMQHKSQAFKKFLEFISQAKNYLGKKLKRYQIDRGKKFDNKALKTYCLECGVQ